MEEGKTGNLLSSNTQNYLWSTTITLHKLPFRACLNEFKKTYAKSLLWFRNNAKVQGYKDEEEVRPKSEEFGVVDKYTCITTSGSLPHQTFHYQIKYSVFLTEVRKTPGGPSSSRHLYGNSTWADTEGKNLMWEKESLRAPDWPRFMRNLEYFEEMKEFFFFFTNLRIRKWGWEVYCVIFSVCWILFFLLPVCLLDLIHQNFVVASKAESLLENRMSTRQERKFLRLHFLSTGTKHIYLKSSVIFPENLVFYPMCVFILSNVLESMCNIVLSLKRLDTINVIWRCWLPKIPLQ